MTDTIVRKEITELEIKGRRLGRHVVHDPRSWKHPAPMAATVASVHHDFSATALPLDQGNLGSCTGNAATGMLMTAPFLPNTMKVSQGRALNEDDAVRFYSRATHIDGYRGVYPTNDTGSSGLAVCKALCEAGYLSGYGWSFGIEHALRTLTLQPTIAGTEWLTGMDTPDSNGVVSASGSVRGGHEYMQVGLVIEDASNLMNPKNLVECLNSWGLGFGLGGRFFITVPDFAKLLANQGDVKTGIL